MPNLNVQADGQTLIKPAAYYFDNVTEFAETAPALVPPLVWVAYSYGGQPNVPQTFSTMQDVLTFLRGAPCSDMAQWIFNPSSELNGASLVTIIPVGSNTQSSFSYLDAAGNPAITVKSANFGLPSNLLQTAVASGTIAGREITLFDGQTNTSIYADNLGVPMQLAYVGTATGVTFNVAVTGTTGYLTTSGANPGENLNVQLGVGGYTTVAQVAEYLNGTGFFQAQVLSAGPSYDHGDFPAYMLDVQGPIAVPRSTTIPPTWVNCNAVLSDPVFWMNHSGSSYVITATAVESSAPAHTLVVTPLSHFAGATSVPPTLSSYAAGLNAALNVPAWVVIADANITGLPFLLAQHAETTSSISYGQWRRAVSGSLVGDNILSAVAMAQDLNTKEMTYCYPGMYRTSNITGVSTVYGGYYVAAAVAGIMAGNPVMTPLTNKTLLGNGVEVSLTTPNIDTLQQGGVLPVLGQVPGNTSAVNSTQLPVVPTIVSDFTTWQNDANPENVFNQQIAGRQFLAYVMVGAMQPYIGSIESSFSILNQKRAAQRALNGQLVNPTSSAGVLNSWVNESLTLNYNGASQLTSITFECTFVGQNRFTVIEAFVQPLNLTA